MSRRVIHVHIERLVLDGFAPGTPGSGARVADGLTRELQRLLADEVPAGWQRGASRERTVGPPLRRAPVAAPERLGEQVAASVYRSFSRGGRR
jgi:hypothetical protein